MDDRKEDSSEQDAYLEDDDFDYYDYQDEFDDEDDDEDDNLWDDDEEEYDLLDNMDPDGAAERFPELARDPRFWFDMLLFVTFLDLLSIIGPRDPYPDIPWV